MLATVLTIVSRISTASWASWASSRPRRSAGSWIVGRIGTVGWLLTARSAGRAITGFGRADGLEWLACDDWFADDGADGTGVRPRV